MKKRWIVVAIVAVLMGLLLAHEDAFEDRRDAGLKTVPGRTAGP